MKNISSCSAQNCKDVIVITIETCDKKSCEACKKNPKAASSVCVRPQDEDVPETPPEETVPRKVLKLPVVPGRLHGPGCAMEISVLEKHEDNCLYKKADNELRNDLDDRVGSYDCIGRLVFKTCNEEDGNALKLGANPSRRFQGQSAMVLDGAISSPIVDGDNGGETLPVPVQSSRRGLNRNQSNFAGSSRSVGNRERSGFESRQSRVGGNGNRRSDDNSDNGSNRRSVDSRELWEAGAKSKSTMSYGPSGQKSTMSARSRRDSDESYASALETSPSMRRDMTRSQVMTVLTPPTYPLSSATPGNEIAPPPKKHYPGDGCKLRYPAPPILLAPKELIGLHDALKSQGTIQALATSTKTFPKLVDQANQVPSRVSTSILAELRDRSLSPPSVKKEVSIQQDSSQETIISLTGSVQSEPEQADSGMSKLFAFFKRKSKPNENSLSSSRRSSLKDPIDVQRWKYSQSKYKK